MSNTSQARGTHSAAGVPRQRDVEAPLQTGWVGWITFAGVMMIMVGSFQAMMGLVALFKSDYYVVTSSDLLVSVSYDSWGWGHLVLGALVAATGFGVLAGQMWARVVGVGLVGIAALVNMAFLAAYPVWSVLLIALDVLVIYALVVHGREMKGLV